MITSCVLKVYSMTPLNLLKIYTIYIGISVPSVNVNRNTYSKLPLKQLKPLTKFTNTISKTNISRLMNVYDFDFKLFGYDFYAETGEAQCKMKTQTGDVCC